MNQTFLRILVIAWLLTGCTRANFHYYVPPVEEVNQNKTVRIAGRNFFALDRQNTADTYIDVDGFLYVTHSPGCGLFGYNGTDEFFGPDRQLPASWVVIQVDYTELWPVGISITQPILDNSTGIPFYGALCRQGSGNGTTSTAVIWGNTCSGSNPFNNQDVCYRISFVIEMPKNADPGEPAFDASLAGESLWVPAGFTAP